jgi:hypothetical protein
MIRAGGGEISREVCEAANRREALHSKANERDGALGLSPPSQLLFSYPKGRFLMRAGDNPIRH